ncbi:MAG: hypothetical protein AABZ74_00980 [Cyanobacteriota bacterium]
MKKFLISILLFCFLIINSSCQIIGSISHTIQAILEICNEPALFPTKNYETLTKAKDFFEYNGEKYTYRRKINFIYHSNRSPSADPFCCECVSATFSFIKNYRKIENGSFEPYMQGDDVNRIGDYYL